MDNKKDPMEQLIVDDLLAEADAIDKEIVGADMEEVPVGLKEEMRKKLHAQIDEYERTRAYAQLSEEDREALELGRKMLKDKEFAEPQGKKVYRKKSRKMYVAVAAVAILVLALGVTSMGGAEKIAKMFGIKVGSRELVQVNTGEDNYIATNDDEEDAYQELREVFGIDPVKIFYRPGDMIFVGAEIDEELQTALLKYEYKGNIISYYVNAFYMDSSLGSDIEDRITDQYYFQHEKCEIEIKEYEIPQSKEKIYGGNYVYEGLEYMIIGRMEKHNFEILIRNLIFF